MVEEGRECGVMPRDHRACLVCWLVCGKMENDERWKEMWLAWDGERLVRLWDEVGQDRTGCDVVHAVCDIVVGW
jgi:hypothetical protein